MDQPELRGGMQMLLQGLGSLEPSAILHALDDLAVEPDAVLDAVIEAPEDPDGFSAFPCVTGGTATSTT